MIEEKVRDFDESWIRKWLSRILDTYVPFESLKPRVVIIFDHQQASGLQSEQGPFGCS